MAALFSCSKCFKRYPFDELSQGKQICKECRNNFPTVKCTYCRAEFQQNSKGSTSSICSKCAYNVKHYGKPTACENCSVLAAFIGNRCQRCVNSERKWGPPKICTQCKLKCAFDRPERRKPDGKLMCWLCDQAYKRVLAKTKKKAMEFGLKSSKSAPAFITSDSPKKAATPMDAEDDYAPLQSMPSEKELASMTVLERLTKIATSGGSSRGNTPTVVRKFGDGVHLPPEPKTDIENRLTELTASKSEKRDEDRERHQRSNKHRHKHHYSKHHKRRHSKEVEEETSSPKKSKASDKAVNGLTGSSGALSTPKSTGSNEVSTGLEAVSSENVILITQLREQIQSLKKQLTVKDSQMLEKDKKINELKAQMYEQDKDFRTKNQTMSKNFNTQIENLQIKNRELTRQVATLSKEKGKKTSVIVDTTNNAPV